MTERVIKDGGEEGLIDWSLILKRPNSGPIKVLNVFLLFEFVHILEIILLMTKEYI